MLKVLPITDTSARLSKDSKAPEEMARNKDRDQAWDIFREFGNVLTSPHWSAYMLTTRDGRQRTYTIGRHDSSWMPETARQEARRILGEVARGADPMADKSRWEA